MTSHFAESPANLDASPADGAVEPVAHGANLEIDRCLEELAHFAQTELPVRDFYAAFLDRLVRLLAAEGGAVWHVGAAEAPTLLAQIHFPRSLQQRQGPSLVREAEPAKIEPIVLPPFARASARHPCDHPHPWPLVACSLAADAQTRIVIEVALDRDAGPDVQAGAARLTGVLAEIAGDFQRRHELRQLRERNARVILFKELVAGLHRSLDPTGAAYAIANDGRQWIGCDRVSVLKISGNRASVLAVSAVDHVDRRSGQVAALERLGAAIAATGETLKWHEAHTDDLPPQLARALADYLDVGHARQLVAIPLRRLESQAAANKEPPLALLVAESFVADRPFETLAERAEELARLGGSALGNALEHHALPLLPIQTSVAKAVSTLAQWPVAVLSGLAAAVVVVALLVFVPADFTVESEGTLQPQIRRNLFAASDGVVEEVLVRHGDHAAKGDVLLRLRNPALDLDQSRLSGELETAEARLAAVRSTRARPDDATAPGDADRLASEEEQLKEQIQGLKNQLAVLHQLRSDLNVASPLDGVVLTWNTQETLDDRPVKQGQLLMTVADATGPWTLELRVSDRAAGHVLAGQRAGNSKLQVSFLIASDPASTHTGHLESLALTTESGGGSSAADAIAAIDGKIPTAARAGGRVTARIHCGQRSIGYVWLHDLIDFVRTTLWL